MFRTGDKEAGEVARRPASRSASSSSSGDIPAAEPPRRHPDSGKRWWERTWGCPGLPPI